MNKPTPRPNGDSRAYWEACNREELVYQRCVRCRRAQFYPRRVCSHCQGPELDWQVSRGTGCVHSFTEVHRTAIPEFAADVPYLIVLVDMDEGFRLMCNADRGSAPLAIGSRGRIGFEDRGGQKVPRFFPGE